MNARFVILAAALWSAGNGQPLRSGLAEDSRKGSPQGSVEASREGKNMSKIAQGNAVVTVGAAAPLPAHAKELGRSKDRVWFSLAWSEILSPANAAVKWDLAYLDENEFRMETQILGPADIAAVIAKRVAERDQFIPTMADQLGNEAGRLGAWEHLGGAQPTVTGAGAPDAGAHPAGAQITAADRREWVRHSELALHVHREAFFTGRSIEKSAEDVTHLLELRNSLETLEGELASSKDCPGDWMVVLKGRQAQTSNSLASLAQAATGMGKPDLGGGKMYDYRNRVVFYQKLNPVVAARVAQGDLVSEKLPQGFLVALTPDELREYQIPGKPVVVFLNSAEWMRFVRLLTAAQWKILIESRIHKGSPTAQDYLAEIIDTRLEFLAILRRFLEEAPASLTATTRTTLETVFSGELDGLAARVKWQSGDPERGREIDWTANLTTRVRVLKLFAEIAGEHENADWAKQALALLDSMETKR